MSAAHFMARAIGHLACRNDLLQARHLDDSARRIEGCHQCDSASCQTRAGELGYAGFAELVRRPDALQLRWACPGCGVAVQEDTSALHAIGHAATIEADAWCHRCRQTAATAPATPTTYLAP